MKRKYTAEAGFTLIELLVVVLIIGILAAIAVPQYFKVVERAKASEATAYIGEVRSAQERYLAKYGTYSATTASFDATLGSLKYFTFTMTADNTPAWSGTLSRTAPCPAVYGCYSVTMTAPAPGTPTTGNTTWDEALLQ